MLCVHITEHRKDWTDPHILQNFIKKSWMDSTIEQDHWNAEKAYLRWGPFSKVGFWSKFGISLFRNRSYLRNILWCNHETFLEY